MKVFIKNCNCGKKKFFFNLKEKNFSNTKLYILFAQKIKTKKDRIYVIGIRRKANKTLITYRFRNCPCFLYKILNVKKNNFKTFKKIQEEKKDLENQIEENVDLFSRLSL